MKNQFLIFCIICLMALGCKKTDTTPASATTNTQTPCQKNNTGTLTVSSSSSNPYMISIDGTDRGSLQGNGSQTYELTVGTHSVKATQESGYVVYPTIKTQQVTISQCQTSGFNY